MGIVILLVLIAGFAIYLTINGKTLIREATETHSPEMIGAKASLRDISLSPFSGHAGLYNFTLAQPDGWGTSTLFSVDEISLEIVPSSVLSPVVEFNQILIDKPVFNIIERDGKTNLEAIQQHIAEYLASTTDTADTTQTKNISIQDFYFNGATVNVDSERFGTHSLSLADIHLTDIGVEDGGVEPSEAFRHITDAITPQITKALVSIGLKSKLKNLLGDEESGDNPIKSITKKIGGLFKKKD